MHIFHHYDQKERKAVGIISHYIAERKSMPEKVFLLVWKTNIIYIF